MPEHFTGGSNPPAADAIRVLVVEDNAEMLSAMGEIFAMEGFQVDSIANGARAAEMAEVNTYDVIVSDIRLPGLNGIDLTRRVQALSNPPRIILITAYPKWNVLTKDFHSYEVFDLLEKPLDLGRLVVRVREAAVGGECS